MNCKACGKKIPIMRVITKDDELICEFCNSITPVKEYVWSDGKIHFNIIGLVKTKDISPRILLENQSTSTLNLPLILTKAIKLIGEKPNLKAICGEFFITENDIYVDVIMEPKK